MAADIELKWEWPANRTSEQRIIIKIENISPQSKGLFGIKKSPSLAQSVPEPVVITGVVVMESDLLNGKKVSLVLPKLETSTLQKGQFAVLNVIGNDTCICIAQVELPLVDLATNSCQ